MFHAQELCSYKVKVPWLCSRSQPGIKVIIRDLRGHLLHTVTFLVNPIVLKMAKTLWSFGRSECNRVNVYSFRESDST